MKKGFTLIELLIVISIIGILSSVVVASLNTAREKARDTNRITDIKQLQLALELYYDSSGSKYPTALSALVPTYIQTMPTDPRSRNQYNYSWDPSSTPRSYHLGAILENTGSAVLSSDADFDSTSYAGGSKFRGNSTNCATGTGTELCFDVKP